MMEIKWGKGRKDWKVVPITSPKTGEHRNYYFYKGQRAQRIPLNSRLAKQLAGYSLIERDLRMVIGWINTINQASDPITYKTLGWIETSKDDASHSVTLGLFIAALTFYGKCFAQCEGRRVQLNSRWIPSGFEDSHEVILSMRNNFAAHSGAEKFEDVKVVLVLASRNGKLKDEPLLFRELKQMEALISHKDDEHSFLLLATSIRAKVLEKLDELNRKIFTEEINPKGLKNWLSAKQY